MPRIYLSPSTQEYNPYITGAGSEEYFMNLLADAMEPYLLANTIRFTRNTPDMTAASSIRQANSGSYDFYLALHSNASADGSRAVLSRYRKRVRATPSSRWARRKPSCSPGDFTAFSAAAGEGASTVRAWASARVIWEFAVALSSSTQSSAGRADRRS